MRRGLIGFARAALLPLVFWILAEWPALGETEVSFATEARRLCTSADVLFRQSRFDEAQRAYQSALDADLTHARAHWGLGRIAALTGHTTAARDYFSEAYRLDPQDPNVVLSYADYVPNPAGRCVLLRNYLALVGPNDRSRRDDVLARLEILERLEDRKLSKRVSPYRHYHFDLTGFFPDGRFQHGVLIAVRIGDGKPLRLVLDTGAEGITVNQSRLRNLHLQTIAAASVDGFGQQRGLTARVALAELVSIGDLRLENCLLQLADREFVPGADGVVGMDIFQDFLIRLDFPRQTLDLFPFPGCTEALCGSLPSAPIYRLSHLILLRAATDGAAGYFLLDTGSSFSAVARHNSGQAPSLSNASLRGVAGELFAPLRLPPLHFAFAGVQLIDESPLALDLQQMSQAAGAEIEGIAGFSLFRRSVFVLDYRNARIQFEK